MINFNGPVKYIYDFARERCDETISEAATKNCSYYKRSLLHSKPLRNLPPVPLQKKGRGEELILHSKIENYTLNQIHSKSKQRVKFLKQRPKK